MNIHFTNCILSILASCVLLISCTDGKAIRTGDLLFVGIPSSSGTEQNGMDEAIVEATGDGSGIGYVHAAILEVDESGRIWVIDATIRHGVDRHPLDTLLKEFRLKDGSAPYCEVMRLKDSGLEPGAFVENAKRYIGEEYDIYFLEGNDRHYCTELIYDSYLTRDGNHIFESNPMNFKDETGEFPQYWVRLFDRLGEDIPQDKPGTNPQDMHRSSALTFITSDINTK